VMRDNRVLLVKGRRKDYFSLPGGKAHRGEPTVSAAARELREETGLVAERVERRPEWDYLRDTQKLYRACSVEASGQARPACGEIREVVWWDGTGALPIHAHVAHMLGLVFHKQTA